MSMLFCASLQKLACNSALSLEKTAGARTKRIAKMMLAALKGGNQREADLRTLTTTLVNKLEPVSEGADALSRYMQWQKNPKQLAKSLSRNQHKLTVDELQQINANLYPLQNGRRLGLHYNYLNHPTPFISEHTRQMDLDRLREKLEAHLKSHDVRAKRFLRSQNELSNESQILDHYLNSRDMNVRELFQRKLQTEGLQAAKKYALKEYVTDVGFRTGNQERYLKTMTDWLPYKTQEALDDYMQSATARRIAFDKALYDPDRIAMSGRHVKDRQVAFPYEETVRQFESPNVGGYRPDPNRVFRGVEVDNFGSEPSFLTPQFNKGINVTNTAKSVNWDEVPQYLFGNEYYTPGTAIWTSHYPQVSASYVRGYPRYENGYLFSSPVSQLTKYGPVSGMLPHVARDARRDLLPSIVPRRIRYGSTPVSRRRGYERVITAPPTAAPVTDYVDTLYKVLPSGTGFQRVMNRPHAFQSAQEPTYLDRVKHRLASTKAPLVIRPSKYVDPNDRIFQKRQRALLGTVATGAAGAAYGASRVFGSD